MPSFVIKSLLYYYQRDAFSVGSNTFYAYISSSKGSVGLYYFNNCAGNFHRAEGSSPLGIPVQLKMRDVSPARDFFFFFKKKELH